MIYKDSDLHFLKKVGEQLKHYRLDQALTQEELAERAGFSRSYYTEIETGKRNISILNLYKLSKALEIPLKKIVNFESPVDTLTRIDKDEYI